MVVAITVSIVDYFLQLLYLIYLQQSFRQILVHLYYISIPEILFPGWPPKCQFGLHFLSIVWIHTTLLTVVSLYFHA